MSFSQASVEELSGLHGEPDWLRAQRRQAFEVYERLPMPSRSDEEWRRTDLRGLDLGAFEAFERPDGAAPSAPIDDTAGVLRQRGSEPGRVELDPAVGARGVLFMPLSQAVKEHPDRGYRLLTELGGFSDGVRDLVRDHHERLDGKGYPRGLTAGQLTLDARILAVCDVYDALISKRVYRDAWSEQNAIDYLRAETGTAFDERCVEALAVVVGREPARTSAPRTSLVEATT